MQCCSRDKRSGKSSSDLAFDDWTGTWKIDRRENWDAFMEFCHIPTEKREEFLVAADFLSFRVDSAGFTLEHRAPVHNMHLLFRGDLDGTWADSPYVFDPAHSNSKCFHSWVEETACFKTEYPAWCGHEGLTMITERRLVSKSCLTTTDRFFEGDTLKAGPFTSYYDRASQDGPAPIAWLRARGKSLATAEERLEVINKVAKLIEEGVEEISSAQAVDRVVPAKFVPGQLLGACKSYQKLVPDWIKPEPLEDTFPDAQKGGVDTDWSVINEPKGVCVNVSPWNAPMTLSVIPMLGMLAAGNRVVVKPPELVPNVSKVFRKLCDKYLRGYVWVEEGDKDAVNRLIDEGPDHLVFTGGAEIAKLVMARCAAQLTPVTLELGGKSPCFIDKGLPDGILSSAVREILETKVYKTGQFCCAHDYALVHEAIYDEFCARLRTQIDELQEKRNVPLIARRQYENVKRKLQDALLSGAECLPPQEGAFAADDIHMTLPMTGLINVPLDTAVLTEEIFGPILPIVKVANIQEAIGFINRPCSAKPLIGYCYSEDQTSIDAFLAQTSSGNVAVNAGPMRVLGNYNAGFGGIGPSGMGTSMWGKDALREFSNRKHVVRAKAGFAQSYFSGPPKPA